MEAELRALLGLVLIFGAACVIGTVATPWYAVFVVGWSVGRLPKWLRCYS